MWEQSLNSFNWKQSLNITMGENLTLLFKWSQKMYASCLELKATARVVWRAAGGAKGVMRVRLTQT